MVNTTCSVDGCVKPVKARGYCGGHYTRWRKGAVLDAPFFWKARPGDVCRVDGCTRPVGTGGYCSRHYTRPSLASRPPLEVRPRAQKGRGPAFVIEAANYSGDDCLLWPFGMKGNGYGTVMWEGRPMGAHRAVLIVAAGPPPFPGADAAHAPLTCHNPACVNPRHLRWASRSENMADAVLDGTRRPRKS